jgi:hypothetical protein
VTTAAGRRLTDDAAAMPLEPLPLDPTTVRAGTPTAAMRSLAELGGSQVGIWELTSGTVTDVESDEVFVVLAGLGTVTFADGSSIDLRPGTVVRLAEGDRTTWEITETLRKVYVA